MAARLSEGQAFKVVIFGIRNKNIANIHIENGKLETPKETQLGKKVGCSKLIMVDKSKFLCVHNHEIHPSNRHLRNQATVSLKTKCNSQNFTVK